MVDEPIGARPESIFSKPAFLLARRAAAVHSTSGDRLWQRCVVFPCPLVNLLVMSRQLNIYVPALIYFFLTESKVKQRFVTLILTIGLRIETQARFVISFSSKDGARVK